MLSKLPRIGAALLGALVLLALGGSTSLISTHGSNEASALISKTGQYDCTGPTSAPASLGAPAIQPHLPGVPAFTRDDVRQFLETHRFAGHRFDSRGTPTITKIIFVTSYEACELMLGEYVGLPDDALVCYVELSGEFSFSRPFSTHPAVLHTGDAVFDARTGNLLVIGVRN